MTRTVVLCLGIILGSAATAETQGMRDAQVSLLANEACMYMGASCAKYRSECSSSPTPNICLVYVHFDMRVAEERCGKSGVVSCFDENRSFSRKWMQELNIPNIENPKRQKAFEVCEEASRYQVKSESLVRLESSLGALLGVGGSLYIDYKPFYECFKEQLEQTQ